MFQYMLLLLEATLLIATAYIFWQTRRTAAEIADASPPPDTDAYASAEQQARAARMMHEVTDLVAELQSLSSATYQDFSRQQSELTQVVEQAEVLTAQLRNLMAQAETTPTRFTPLLFDPAASLDKTPSVKVSPAVEPSKTMTWGQTLMEFNHYLADNGRTDNTITRANTHIRQFLTWQNGQHFENIPFGGISSGDIEDYTDYLTEQAYQQGTVQRKLTALRTFTQWLDVWPENKFTPQTLPAAVPPELQAEAPVPAPPSQPSPPNRFKAVFALAEQGLDQPEIAARTGLEQEAVRMLLMVRSNSI